MGYVTFRNTGRSTTTIQEAVNIAGPGETIIVGGGTYDENVIVNTDYLTIENAPGEQVIVNGQVSGLASTFTVAEGISLTLRTSDGEPGNFIVNAPPGVAQAAALYLAGDNDTTNDTTEERESRTPTSVTEITLNADGGHALLTGGAENGLAFTGNVFGGAPGGPLVYVQGTDSLSSLPASTDVKFIDNIFNGDAGGSPLLGVEADGGEISGNQFTGSSSYAILELWGDGILVEGNDFRGASVNGNGTYISDSAGTYQESALVADNIFDGSVYIQGKNGVYASIQAAVNAASDGDTIVVGPGTYNENVTIDNEALTIVGANQGVEGAQHTGTESSIVGRVTVSGAKSVTFDGLEFRATSSTGTTGPSNAALSFSGSGDHAVQNSVFFNTTNGGGTNARAIMLDTTVSGDVAITGNLFTGSSEGKFSTAAWSTAVWSDGSSPNLDITDNTFRGVRTGLNLDGYSDATTEVAGNTFVVAGSGISVGLPKTTTVEGIHDNLFANVDSDFNFRNVATPITVDLAATQNGSTASNVTSLLAGTAGDTLTGTSGADIIAADGRLPGETGFETVGGNDTVDAGQGADIVYAGAGNDGVDGGVGSDNMDGGSGTDTARFAGAYTGYTITESNGTYTVSDGTDTDTLTRFEFFDFNGNTVATSNPSAIVSAGPSIDSVVEAGTDEDGDPDTLAVDENSPSGTPVATVTADDPNLAAGDALTFTLVTSSGAAYTGPFSITKTGTRTASIVVAGATDYEAATAHDFLVKVTDGTGRAATQAVNVAVLDRNDVAPTITSDETASVVENTPASTIVYTAEASDPDTVGTRGYSLSGDDAALFSISASSGEVRFLSSPDFEAPADRDGDNVYELVVRASDGVNESTKDVTIRVMDVNETPVAVDDGVVVRGRSASTGNVLANDGDPDAGDVLHVTSVQLAGGSAVAVPASGTVTVAGAYGTLVIAADGSYSYQALNRDGSDAFTYTVADDAGVTDTAQLLVEVEAVAPTTSASSQRFSFAFTQAQVEFRQNEVLLTGPDGVTYDVTGMDTLTFTDGTIQENDGAPLVDDLFYYDRNLDVWAAGVDADQHYGQYGWREGRDPDAYFSTSGYLGANQDVKAAGINPLQHYDQYGWREGRDPGVNFDTTLYLQNNPDVRAAGLDPLAHFLQYGQEEGRAVYEAVGPGVAINSQGGFDAEYYLLANVDVAQAVPRGDDAFAFALQHYNDYGRYEGRDPNGLFDTSGYLAANPDVAAAGINPLQHYHQYGWREGRDPSGEFDTSSYLAANPDVAAADIDPLVHYLQYGIYEGRNPFADGQIG